MTDKRHRGHPEWADPPYPEIPPTPFARLLIRMTEWATRQERQEEPMTDKNPQGWFLQKRGFYYTNERRRLVPRARPGLGRGVAGQEGSRCAAAAVEEGLMSEAEDRMEKARAEIAKAHDRSDPNCEEYDDSDTDEHMGHCVLCCDGWCMS